MMNKFRSAAAIAIAIMPAHGFADEVQFFVGSGLQAALSSNVAFDYNDGISRDIDFDWEGRSYSLPFYWSVRGINWFENDYGIGLQVTHNKAYGARSIKEANGINTLEFSDGLNIATATIARRWRHDARTYYVGAELGLNFPHVEYREGVQDELVSEFQITGPSAGAYAGVIFPWRENFSLYSELAIQGSKISAELGNYGSLDTQIITPAIRVGVTYQF